MQKDKDTINIITIEIEKNEGGRNSFQKRWKFNLSEIQRRTSLSRKNKKVVEKWHWAKGVASLIVGATKVLYLDDAVGSLVVMIPSLLSYSVRFFKKHPFETFTSSIFGILPHCFCYNNFFSIHYILNFQKFYHSDNLSLT